MCCLWSIVHFQGANTRELELDSYIIKLDMLGMDDVETVGGKNASLGEMISNLGGLGVQVPGGFATTSAAYLDFLVTDQLGERIQTTLRDLVRRDVGGCRHLSGLGSGTARRPIVPIKVDSRRVRPERDLPPRGPRMPEGNAHGSCHWMGQAPVVVEFSWDWEILGAA